ncbi:dnaJ homolog subfamily C member 30, mitochondrial-like [Vespa crabro]|uniref:dnaJ homolog subfamily C member 30, mitochondrial-like n=1 Tax=Vespa crabro TaxID=7445 RepID=UPI001EFF74C9|nr:dnaJ homolog subfamily C member 30, mitochondrial-like [Vespa crabro]
MSITMHVGTSYRWIEKISRRNDLTIILACRLIQSKSCAYVKMKTHYDTLKVSPNATQNEIKSSYYKLSMLYHPDRNKSEHAKRKFQDISQAYDVLNNYQTRKRYDRSIMIKENVEENAPKVTYTYASVYKSKVDPMGNKYFNFDEWTRQHYGERLYVRRRKEKFTEANNKINESTNNNNLFPYWTILFLIVFLISRLVYPLKYTTDYDVPQKKKEA